VSLDGKQMDLCRANSYYVNELAEFHRFVKLDSAGTVYAHARSSGPLFAFFGDPDPTVGARWDPR